ncbi:MAG TPA: LPS export ABC transporter periplasmic protein LptC [Phenylobacterium sp.]|jgi:lipopolysaccharide export system protein LptC|uniref:LPS export ABC transporter periplasmic protein LptC n=1 Tax=Phenylobacterium sp. TaxID=1871053 RepID=UPI002CFD87EA|nr:LPS export ABC transporter periplasmic protein LptC [Phenylobacterium sp.]HXA39980.1 LPS export ABC transporter periplasmic protein LptC [Phenylobacterium sp.]
MSAVSDIPLPGTPSGGASRRASIQRWRRRSRLIRLLRVALPALIGAILLGLGASVVYNAFASRTAPARDSNAPIRLVNPHFVGRDAHGKPFLLTSVTATRDPQNYQRVYLDRPTLTLDTDGPDPLHITGGSGIFHEDTGKLEVSKGVRMSGARGSFATDSSLFDTKTQELVGSASVQGLGSLGEIQAKSYGVYDNGARMVFSGAVHTRLQPK